MTPPLEGVVEKKKAAVVGETTAAFFFGTRGRLPPSWILKQVQDDRIFFVLWLLHKVSLNRWEAVEGY